MKLKNLEEVNRLSERLKSLREMQSLFNSRYAGDIECTIKANPQRGTACIAVIDQSRLAGFVQLEIDVYTKRLQEMGVEL